MAINISALNAFRGAAQWNNDAVANLSGDGISSPGAKSCHTADLWKTLDRH